MYPPFDIIIDGERETNLEVSAATFPRLALISEIEESALRPIKDEPALVPRLEPGSHFVQVAAGGRGCQRDVRAEFHLMAGRLDMLAQVETVAADG